MTAERIVAAACRINEVVFSIPRPARHHHILHEIYVFGGRRLHSRAWCEQGFLTSEGRFVDRLEAVSIAKQAKQIIEPKWPPDLYSEDLW